MRVLITGIGGFVGRHLASRLTAVGHDVYGLSLRPACDVAAVEVHTADVRDRDQVDEVVASSRPEAVVHLAGLARPRANRPPDEFMGVNVGGTQNVVESVSQLDVARIVLASSGQVYGKVEPESQPISEDHPRAPLSPYGESKAKAEDIVLGHPAGMVVRSFNSIGQGQPPGFALPDFAHKLADIKAGRREVLECGNLSARLDFLHVSDAVEGYRAVLEHGEPGAIYNLASGVDRLMEEMLDLLIEVSGVRARVEAGLAEPVIGLLKGDNQRLRALGWQPAHTVGEALQELWDEVSRAA